MTDPSSLLSLQLAHLEDGALICVFTKKMRQESLWRLAEAAARTRRLWLVCIPHLKIWRFMYSDMDNTADVVLNWSTWAKITRGGGHHALSPRKLIENCPHWDLKAWDGHSTHSPIFYNSPSLLSPLRCALRGTALALLFALPLYFPSVIHSNQGFSLLLWLSLLPPFLIFLYST